MRTVQRAQGLPIAIVGEISFENGWITRGHSSWSPLSVMARAPTGI